MLLHYTRTQRKSTHVESIIIIIASTGSVARLKLLYSNNSNYHGRITVRLYTTVVYTIYSRVFLPPPPTTLFRHCFSKLRVRTNYYILTKLSPRKSTIRRDSIAFRSRQLYDVLSGKLFFFSISSNITRCRPYTKVRYTRAGRFQKSNIEVIGIVSETTCPLFIGVRRLGHTRHLRNFRPFTFSIMRSLYVYYIT